MSTAAALYFLLQSLNSPGGVAEGYLGLHGGAPSFVDEGSLEDPDLAFGLVVVSVIENSPAEAAGVKVGDVILQLGGEVVRTSAHLEALAAALAPGGEARLTLRRGAQVLELSAFAVPRLHPRETPAPARFVEGRKLGITVESLTGEESAAADLPPGDGLRVRKILKGSPVEDTALAEGDVIVAVGASRVHGGEDFLAISRGLVPGETTVLVVARRGADGKLGEARIPVEVRDPESYLSYFHLPGIVIYEHDPRKKETTFGLILNLFKYTRKENQSTYRFFWFIPLTFGTNEELEEVRD